LPANVPEPAIDRNHPPVANASSCKRKHNAAPERNNDRANPVFPDNGASGDEPARRRAARPCLSDYKGTSSYKVLLGALRRIKIFFTVSNTMAGPGVSCDYAHQSGMQTLPEIYPEGTPKDAMSLYTPSIARLVSQLHKCAYHAHMTSSSSRVVHTRVVPSSSWHVR
jgi:hypothetical protein